MKYPLIKQACNIQITLLMSDLTKAVEAKDKRRINRTSAKLQKFHEEFKEFKKANV